MFDKFPTAPSKRVRNSKTACIPFDTLEPGESFIVPFTVAKRATIISAAHRYGKNTGRDIRTRIVENGVEIYRK